jgi:aldose 1-epimerase
MTGRYARIVHPLPIAEPFGELPDGRRVQAYRLANGHGMSVRLLTYGGIVASIDVPDSLGRVRNVALGFARLDDYVLASPYFGAVIGRFANRIAEGRFDIDGVTHHVAVNEAPSSVHGGAEGFDKKLWTAAPCADDSCVGVRLRYISVAGEEGFPGTLQADVTYRLAQDTNTLRIDYRATTDGATVVNLTNHSYINLAGEGSGSVLDHVLQVDADHYLPLRPDLIPTGEVAPVVGTPMDFRSPHRIGDRIRIGTPQLVTARGYDHNYVLTQPGDWGSGVRFAARLRDPGSGRTLEVWTCEPAVDVYSGNFLDGTLVGTSGAVYRQSDAIAIEPEHVSNSPNIAHMPSTVLRPGEVYESCTEYRFTA